MLAKIRDSVFFRSLGVFTLAVPWFACCISWSLFPDPDAFYHAKVAWLVSQSGPLRSFPWLDLTSLGTSFADHHFLFHVFESPFVASFGLFQGARYTAIVLAAAFLSVAYGSFRMLHLKPAGLWTVLGAVTPPLLLRLLLAKASPLALLWFTAGMAAAWGRKRPLLFAVAALFALSHGGWIFLVAVVWLMAFGDALCRFVVESVPWRDAFRETLFYEAVVATLGAVAGTVAHPNFPSNLSFLWVQVVKIGLGTPYAHVMLGREWLPVTPLHLFPLLSVWAITGALAVVGIMVAPARGAVSARMRQVMAFAVPAAFVLALTFKSQRVVEYLVPLLALWVASMWQLVEIRAYWSFLSDFSSASRRFTVMGIVAVCLTLSVGKGVVETYRSLHASGYGDHAYQDVMAPVSARAHPGERVFHSDWDEFPMLFTIDDRLKYVVGLDPTFLYEASSTLSDSYREVTWGKIPPTVDETWDFIHDRIHARFIFIAKTHHEALFDVVRSDPRYELLAETEEAATFAVN